MPRLRGSEEANIDPDLTPMLDLVLNVLMFFITTSQMAEKLKHPEVELPESQVAIPLDSKADKDWIILTVDTVAQADQARGKDDVHHEVRFDLSSKRYVIENLPRRQFGKETGDRELLIAELARAFQRKKRDAGAKPVTTSIIIRADERSEYLPLFDLLSMCEKAGFRNLKLRAKTK